jgi:hypothetical protein
MGFDVEAELKALEGFEADREEANDKVLELIQARNRAFIEVDIDGFKLKVKPTIPKSVIQIEKKLRGSIKEDSEETDDDIGYVQKLVALGLSLVCVDDDFRDPKTWLLVLDKTDDVIGTFTTVMDRIVKTQEDVKNFRKK